MAHVSHLRRRDCPSAASRSAPPPAPADSVPRVCSTRLRVPRWNSRLVIRPNGHMTNPAPPWNLSGHKRYAVSNFIRRQRHTRRQPRQDAPGTTHAPSGRETPRPHARALERPCGTAQRAPRPSRSSSPALVPSNRSNDGERGLFRHPFGNYLGLFLFPRETETGDPHAPASCSCREHGRITTFSE